MSHESKPCSQKIGGMNELLMLSVEQLAVFEVRDSMTLGTLAGFAALLEATSIKAGNVHPSAAFCDMNYDDFRESARVIARVIDQNQSVLTGELILSMVQATREEVGVNTNLGINLLFGPIVRASRRVAREISKSAEVNVRYQQLQIAIAAVLKQLDATDSDLVYQAIRLAKPGGIGQAAQADIRGESPSELLQAMQTASAWDDIAKAYATEFQEVFELAKRVVELRSRYGGNWCFAIQHAQLERLASHGDSLVARRNPESVVHQIKELAASCLEGFNATDSVSNPQWSTLDYYLRQDGHRRNPGTTADLLAAATFVALLGERQCQKLELRS